MGKETVMPLYIIRDDITKMECDAIVNAANNSLLGGGGVDGAIHRAAGPLLLEECRYLGGCDTGKAKITYGYRLPCKYIIHTVGPVWSGGESGERELLSSCYREALSIAWEKECTSIAFPLISGGAYGYPKKEALSVATEVISDFLKTHEMDVYMVIYDKETVFIDDKLYENVQAYVDRKFRPPPQLSVREKRVSFDFENSEDLIVERKYCYAAPSRMPSDKELEARLKERDESFSEMLLRLIDERGMKDSECYKKANVDRKHFSKIRSDVNYRPSKQTALAFAIALQLDHSEAVRLLRSAGFAFSRSSIFDIIIEYFIEQGIYDIYTINQTLFSFDQCTLGA